MKKLTLAALAVSLSVSVALYSSCGGCDPTNPQCNAGVGGGSGGGGGTGGGGGLDLYDRYPLDMSYSDRFYMDMVVDQTAGKSRVGIAYMVGVGEIPIIYTDAGITSDGGTGADGGMYAVRYVEWENGVVKPTQNVDAVKRMVGISIDFHPSTGEPAIGYLGGGSDMSLYWFNSDAELATRTGGSTWAKEAAAVNGFQVMCGNPVSDQPVGVVVGIWPAVAYQADGTLWYCYRDVHTGQYPQGDWGGADIECVHGGPGAWSRECAYAGGNTKDAPGGRIRLKMVDDVPTIIWDHATGGADTRGTDIMIQSHLPAGGWGVPFNVIRSGDTQAGGSLAWDGMTEGVGVVGLDLSDGILRYSHRPTGTSLFTTADQVFGEGTGGWYPSLAMDPVNHEPAIAFYVCSQRSAQNPSQCQPDFDEVRVSQRVNDDWIGHTERVDTVSATAVKMGFLPDGRKAVAYREKNGALWLAVRKAP